MSGTVGGAGADAPAAAGPGAGGWAAGGPGSAGPGGSDTARGGGPGGGAQNAPGPQFGMLSPGSPVYAEIAGGISGGVGVVPFRSPSQ
jgi:DNA polymerase III subunit gamma/tau